MASGAADDAGYVGKGVLTGTLPTALVGRSLTMEEAACNESSMDGVLVAMLTELVI